MHNLVFCQCVTPNPIASNFLPSMSLLVRLIKVMLNASKVLAVGMVKQLLDILMKIALIPFQRQDIISLLRNDLSRDF